jgi:hypothetical protein
LYFHFAIELHFHQSPSKQRFLFWHAISLKGVHLFYNSTHRVHKICHCNAFSIASTNIGYLKSTPSQISMQTNYLCINICQKKLSTLRYFHIAS